MCDGVTCSVMKSLNSLRQSPRNERGEREPLRTAGDRSKSLRMGWDRGGCFFKVISLGCVARAWLCGTPEDPQPQEEFPRAPNLA